MQAGQTKNGIGMTLAACLWLGLFPLLQFGTYRTMTRDKWTLMLILAGATLLCFAADLCFRKVGRPRPLPLAAGAGLLGWTILSCLLSPYPSGVWWIGAGRMEGLSTQLCYFGLFFLFSFARVRRGPVLFAAAGGVLAFGAVVLMQRAGGNPFGLYPDKYSYAVEPMFQGTIGHVDMCAGYLLIVSGLFLPACIGFLRRPQPSAAARNPARRISFFVCLSALAVCVWLLLTIDVQLGVLTLLVLVVWTLLRLLPSKARLPVLLLLLAAVLLIAWCWPGQSGTGWELHEILHGRPQLSFGSWRVGVWTYSLTLLREEGRLLAGTGADTFALRFNTFLNQYFASHPEAERLLEYYDNPHSEYLALIINCGIPAFLFFLVLVVSGCFGAPAWRDSVLCYGVQALLSFSVCLVAPMFWVVLGLAHSVFRSGSGLPGPSHAS